MNTNYAPTARGIFTISYEFLLICINVERMLESFSWTDVAFDNETMTNENESSEVFLH